MKYGVRLGALSREVYTALKASKGSQEALQQLIKQHAPHQTGPQNSTSTPPSTPQTQQIQSEWPKSSVNQAS